MFGIFFFDPLKTTYITSMPSQWSPIANLHVKGFDPPAPQNPTPGA